MSSDPISAPGPAPEESSHSPRSTAELRALPVVARLLDPHELGADTAEHLLATLLEPGALEVLDDELNLTGIVVDLRAGVGRIEDLIAPEGVAVEVPELIALLRAYLVEQGRDPSGARRRPPSELDRRWIVPPGGPPATDLNQPDPKQADPEVGR